MRCLLVPNGSGFWAAWRYYPELNRIHPAYLAWALDELADGRVVNQVVVDEETARDAKVALERMLAAR